MGIKVVGACSVGYENHHDWHTRTRRRNNAAADSRGSHPSSRGCLIDRSGASAQDSEFATGNKYLLYLAWSYRETFNMKNMLTTGFTINDVYVPISRICERFANVVTSVFRMG